MCLQTLLTDQHEEMLDAKEDGTPMPLAHYNVGDGSHITLRIHVSSACCVACRSAPNFTRSGCLHPWLQEAPSS